MSEELKEHVPSVSVQVFGGKKSLLQEYVNKAYEVVRSPEAKKQSTQIVTDHLARIAKVASNNNLSVATRVSKLTDMAKQYSDGYPYKNNQFLNELRIDGTPILARQAHAAADQLRSIEKAKYGKDVGGMGNQE